MTEQEQKAFDLMREALNSLCKLALSGESVLWTAEYDAARQALTAANAVVADKSAPEEPVAYIFTHIQSGDVEFSSYEDEKLGEGEMWHREALIKRPL